MGFADAHMLMAKAVIKILSPGICGQCALFEIIEGL
jgi:hypothetical protein